MPHFMFAYHGGKKPDSPEEGQAAFARWLAWIEDLGDKMVNPGTPLAMSKTVSIDGVEDHGGPNPIMGFSVVEADDMDEAVQIAISCPFAEMGTIEVGQMMEMPKSMD